MTKRKNATIKQTPPNLRTHPKNAYGCIGNQANQAKPSQSKAKQNKQTQKNPETEKPKTYNRNNQPRTPISNCSKPSIQNRKRNTHQPLETSNKCEEQSTKADRIKAPERGGTIFYPKKGEALSSLSTETPSSNSAISPSILIIFFKLKISPSHFFFQQIIDIHRRTGLLY